MYVIIDLSKEREVNLMDYDMIERKVKDFILNQLRDAKNYACSVESVRNYRAIAFGALDFACNNLFPAYNEDLADWCD